MRRKKIKLIIILAIPVFVLTGFCFWFNSNNKLETESNLIISVDYNQELFLRAVSRFPKDLEISATNISGLIAPHHDIASLYTAELFQKVSRKDIKKVIIIGPNHENSGAGDIITGNFSYRYLGEETSFDKLLIDKLLKDKIAVLDNERLATEHSISALMPFVNYYFEDAKIVPLIISNRVSLNQSIKLGQCLATYLDEETLIIASIDFSHYLSTEQANDNDVITRAALLSRDYNKIFSLNSDYLDSPAALVAVLSATYKHEASQIQIIRQANLAEAIGAGSVSNSTSYLTALLYH